MFEGNKIRNNLNYILGVFAVTVLLAGCEAKLDLSKVEATQNEVMMRYDQYQAAAKSSVAAVVIGNRGTMLVSRDAGESWDRLSLPGDSPTAYPTLVDVEVCADDRFVALDTDRKVWVSDGSASEWISKKITTEEEVLDLTCDPNGNLWVVGSFTLIMESKDGGDSWEDKSIFEDAMFSKIQFLDDENGFVTGEFGTVLSTSDGGNTWEPQTYIPNEFYPMASLFLSSEKGWVGGLQGIIFQTLDGGQSWQRQETGTVAPIYNIFEANGEVYAIGEQGTMLNFADMRWQPVDVQLGFGYLRGAVSLDDKKLLIAGGSGLVRILDQQTLR